MSVKIKKSKLLAKLQSNREQHQADYERAMKNWRKEVAAQAKKVVAEAEVGTLKGMSGVHRHHRGDTPHPLNTTIFEEPQNHLSEYDTVIGMLEMSEDATMLLALSQFRCYVQDEWDWKVAWVSSNTKYL